ncbi:MAG TPA: SHOCT domain-containing protein [Candidatus Limnocylindrales bacterium]
MDPGFGFGFVVFTVISFATSIGVTVLLIVLIVLGIRWLLRANRNAEAASRPGARDDAAIAALRERFARGEIDETEYRERLRILGG